MDAALNILNKIDTELIKKSNSDELIINMRKYINQYHVGADFLNALANGNLDVDPPDDPLHQNYMISQYKQLVSNLRHLTWQTQQIAKGDLKQKVSFMGEFSIAFNKMIESLREKEQMEEKIKFQNEQLQKLNAEKDKFFSIIAHDLRSPLCGFVELTELMTDESFKFTSEKKKEMSLTLSKSSRNILNLLDNLLKWSQMRRGKIAFEPMKINLKELAEECLKIYSDMAANKLIEIETDIPEHIIVFADLNMLKSIICNLISNAIKYTLKKGNIKISAAPDNNNMILIAVKDSGIGMDNDMVANLFRLDAKNNRPGTEGEVSTGLGLHICKEFVEKNAGNISVESEPYNGSTFYFSIPPYNQQDKINLLN